MTSCETKAEELTELLAARYGIYQLLHALTAQKPTAVFADTVLSSTMEECASIYGLDKELQALRDALASMGYEEDKDKALDELGDEFTRCYVGPAKLPAPMWESVYISEEKLLFTASVLNVRHFYERYGFRATQLHAVPDDSLDLMIEFQAELSKQALEFAQDGKWACCKEILDGQMSFTEKHMLNWVPEYTKAMEDYVPVPKQGIVTKELKFYNRLATLLLAFIRADKNNEARFGELLVALS